MRFRVFSVSGSGQRLPNCNTAFVFPFPQPPHPKQALCLDSLISATWCAWIGHRLSLAGTCGQGLVRPRFAVKAALGAFDAVAGQQRPQGFVKFCFGCVAESDFFPYLFGVSYWLRSVGQSVGGLVSTENLGPDCAGDVAPPLP